MHTHKKDIAHTNMLITTITFGVKGDDYNHFEAIVSKWNNGL
jgi:hypothetical protein